MRVVTMLLWWATGRSSHVLFVLCVVRTRLSIQAIPLYPPPYWVSGPCSEREAHSFFVARSCLSPGMPYWCFCCGADPRRASLAESRESWVKGQPTMWWQMCFAWQMPLKQSWKRRKKSCCRSRVIGYCGTHQTKAERWLSPGSLSFLSWLSPVTGSLWDAVWTNSWSIVPQQSFTQSSSVRTVDMPRRLRWFVLTAIRSFIWNSLTCQTSLWDQTTRSFKVITRSPGIIIGPSTKSSRTCPILLLWL